MGFFCPCYGPGTRSFTEITAVPVHYNLRQEPGLQVTCIGNTVDDDRVIGIEPGRVEQLGKMGQHARRVCQVPLPEDALVNIINVHKQDDLFLVNNVGRRQSIAEFCRTDARVGELVDHGSERR
jgi:hypothetical protein